MSILLVIPTLKQGGAERVISELANSWASQGLNVHLILLVGGEKFYELHEEVTVHNLGFVNNSKSLIFLNELKILIKLRLLIIKNKPDFVLSFITKYNIFTIMASLFLNVNVFVSDRNNPKTRLTYLIRTFRKIAYPLAAGVIAQTSLAKFHLQKESLNNNIHVIPNPLMDSKHINSFKKEKIIINVGRLVPQKGQKYLLDVFSKINDHSWKLVILGDGPLRLELESYAKDLGIFERIEMPGAVNNVNEWLLKSEIFAFTSTSEGFPNALVEAMAFGLPCISFDCDAGPRDIIESEVNGYLVPVGDVSTFITKIEMLMDNSALRKKIGVEAEKVNSKFNIKKISDVFLKFCTIQ